MTTPTRKAGQGKYMLSRITSWSALLSLSAASLLLFLGASVRPVFTVPRITLRTAAEWNAHLASLRSRPARETGGDTVDPTTSDTPATADVDAAALSAAIAHAGAELDLGALLLEHNAREAERRSSIIADPFLLDLSLAAFSNSLSLPDDSLDIPPSDSTTRARFLPDRKRPSPVAQPFPDRVSPLYLQSGAVQRIVTVDSTKNEVLIRETVNGRDVRIPYRMSLEEYILARYNYERNRRTAEEGGRYKVEEGDALQNLIKNITEIDIPIAPNPLMSIFGDRSRISVRINGAIDINAGFRIESSDQQSVFLRPTQFSPNFKQQVQINVNGLVGDKLSIKADWSTERTFDYENQLKIKYTGYEDEIVQSVEAGNVSLQTPSTLISGSGALFGIKAEFQVGPLRLSAIASQKKGEGSKLSISGGAQEQKFERRAYEYSDNYFFVDLAYREDNASGQNPYESYYNYRFEHPGSNAPVLLRPDLIIKEIEVWTSRPATSGVITDPEEREAIAFIDNPESYQPGSPDFPSSYAQYLDPNIRVEAKSGEIEAGKFKRLVRDVDYSLNPATGIISLNQSVQEDQVIAVAYRVEGAEDTRADDDQVIGTFAGDQRLKTYKDANNIDVPSRMVLKLVKPRNLTPSFTKAWKLKVKSIYSLNSRNLRPEDLANFKLVYRSGGQPDQEVLPDISAQLIRLFGLDNTDDNGGYPDGRIDFLPGLTVNQARGEIIFPTLEPWNEGLKTIYSLLLPNQPLTKIEPFLFPDIYTNTKSQARLSANDKIMIAGTTRGSSSAIYQLGFNVVAGSVRVTLNGSPLTPGVDYTVNEQVGSVQILKEEALAPGARLDIEYEKQDLFTFASKTLLGARGEVEINKDSYFGFTWMSLSQKTLSDKVRIGEEPISNAMFGIDAKTTLDLPVLTDALNTLPFLSTKEKSTLTLQGEAAMVMPGESSKTSTIPSDGGESIAYLDDFEGSRIFIPLQTSYTVWRLASVPNRLPDNPTVGNDSLMNTQRAKLDWYNLPITSLSDRTVRVDDIWPEKSVAREDQRVTVLDLDYYPTRRGPFNYQPDLAQQRENWAGVMRLLPSNASNLIDGNFNYIELWMKVENQSGGKLIIDLGKVSEDVIPNGKLNSEDDVLPGSIRNGILNAGEDVGLDMLTDEQERQLFANEIAQGLIPVDDPSGDNYVYDANDWTRFNGTQGNGDQENGDPAGQFPDTEDLNNNSILDLANDYYRYIIDLDTTRFNDPSNRNPYVVGGGTNGWYQFRIPLNLPDEEVGTPALDNVEFLRVLISGVESANPDTPLNVRIAEFNFVGNQWYERLRNDKHFAVSVVSVEDNPEYDVPPGVIRPRDRTRPDQQIFGNEQSLALNFIDLDVDSLREAYRLFPGTGIDLFNYRRLKMYVHGDPRLDGRNYEMVMRFGIDTANYYEYRAPIKAGWASENEVDIDFSELTAVKALIDSSSGYNDFPSRSNPDARFWVYGSPDIVRVQFISVGVRNLDNSSMSGSVWINELRVIQPNTKNGYAYNASMNLRLADIADISANTSYSDPYFHGISDRFSATRAWTTSWSMNTTLNIDKVFPEDWKGTQVRVTYSHAENLRKPLLLADKPDVEVEAAVSALADQMRRDGKSQREIDTEVRNARIATQTLEIRDSWSIPTVRLKAPGESWLVKDVVNRLELSYNYSITRFRDPVYRSRRNWQWQARVGYGFDFGRESYIQPFKKVFADVFLLDFYKNAKWYFLPTRIGADATLERSRIEEVERFPLRYRPYTRTFTHGRSANLAFTLSEESLLNLSGNLSANTRTSLLGLETEQLFDANGQPVLDDFGLPIVTQRQSSAIFRDVFFGKGNLNLGPPTSYQQQFSLQSRPSFPELFNLSKLMDLSMGYSVSYSWQQNIQQADQGRSASYNASINSTLNIKLKQMFEPLFPERKSAAAATTPERKPVPGRRSVPQQQPDPEPKPEEEEELRYEEMPLRELLKQLERRDPAKYQRDLEELRNAVEKENELAAKKSQVKQDEDLEGVVKLNEEIQAARKRAINLLRNVEEPKREEGEEAAARASSLASALGTLEDVLYYGIKVPFLDFDNLAFTFAQNNTSQVGGVRGQTGFSSFWTSVPFGNPPDADLGPSRLYQLGLISDPNPSSGRLAFKSSFPFVGIENYRRGLRAPNPNGNFVDNYSQSNTFSIKTNRPLWEGARIDLNWDLKWSLNKNYQIKTDDMGVQTITSVTTTGKLERSYLAFPDFLFFSFFNTNMGQVNERFQELRADQADTRKDSEKLAEAFEEGFEALPWLSSIMKEFFPRVNWGLRWDGLEKWSLLEGLADRISLEHRYSSSLSSSWRNSPDDGSQITESRMVGYNFQPLIGVQLGFNEVWGGNLSVSTRWSKKGTFNLNSSSSNITEDNSDEFTLNGEFKKTGFNLPMFGLSLQNDINFNLAFSLNKNASRIYSISDLGSGGQPREGTTRITIEPRVRYSISQRVQASIFYRYQRTRPDAEAGSRIPGTTVHEGGLEMRITIAGS
ncbi:MAG TPA: cell surface protein SprA [Bacteroidota bacterium]|nr:cell surface protein SprA [Bacteroidota bacterium]